MVVGNPNGSVKCNLDLLIQLGALNAYSVVCTSMFRGRL